MFLLFSWPRGHVLRGLQMELGEENGSDTWRVCYPQKQTQGVGVLGVHANTNGRQGSGARTLYGTNSSKNSSSFTDREGSHGPLPWRSAVLSPLNPASPCLLSPSDNWPLLQPD